MKSAAASDNPKPIPGLPLAHAQRPDATLRETSIGLGDAEFLPLLASVRH